MQCLRDNPASADSEFSMIRDDKDSGVWSSDGRVLALLPHPERTIIADFRQLYPYRAGRGVGRTRALAEYV
jgi:hypothetical protein